LSTIPFDPIKRKATKPFDSMKESKVLMPLPLRFACLYVKNKAGDKMKKLLVTIFALLSLSSLGYSQVIIDEVDINQLEDVQYCELVGQGKFSECKNYH
jgi:hypothetical protein